MMTTQVLSYFLQNANIDISLLYKKRDILEILFKSLYNKETILSFEKYENEKIEQWSNSDIIAHIRQRTTFTFEHIFKSLISFHIIEKARHNKYCFKLNAIENMKNKYNFRLE